MTKNMPNSLNKSGDVDLSMFIIVSICPPRMAKGYG